MILFLVAVFLTVSFLALYIKYEPKPDFSERIIILISAFAAVLMDFAVEYFGTTAGSWNYPLNTSLFSELLFGHIPLELPIIFASFGANVALIALQNRKNVTLSEINRHMSRKTILAFFFSINRNNMVFLTFPRNQCSYHCYSFVFTRFVISPIDPRSRYLWHHYFSLRSHY